MSFECGELGSYPSRVSLFTLAERMHLRNFHLGCSSYFSAKDKIALMVLKAYTNFSDSELIEHLNDNIHYQLFCGVQIVPLHPLTNYKIVSAIRQKLATKLDIESLQEVLARHWKPYLKNLHVCMTDTSCYESHMRFPADVKLLWGSVQWIYRHLCKQCRSLHV